MPYYTFGDYGLIIENVPTMVEKLTISPFMEIRKKLEPDFRTVISIDVFQDEEGIIDFDRDRVKIIGNNLSPADQAALVAFILNKFPSFFLCAKVIDYISKQPGWPRHELAVVEQQLEAAQKSCEGLRKRVEEAESELRVLKDRMGRNRDVAQWYFFNFGVEL